MYILESNHDLAMQSLRLAIDIHLQSSPINGKYVSRCYHSLVQLVLHGQAAEEAEQNESWKVLNKVLDLMDSVAKVRHNYVQ